jgi:hypothetical protein
MDPTIRELVLLALLSAFLGGLALIYAEPIATAVFAALFSAVLCLRRGSREANGFEAASLRARLPSLRRAERLTIPAPEAARQRAPGPHSQKKHHRGSRTLASSKSALDADLVSAGLSTSS